VIYCLGFEKYYEDKEYLTDACSALLSIYDIYRRRGLNCSFLYKYKLPDLKNDWVNPKLIQNKFGAVNPDRLDFSKIDTDYVILYHLDIYKSCPDKIGGLFEFCIENNKDLFLPVKVGTSYVFNPDFWKEIRNQLDKYEHQLFEINQIEDEFKLQKVIERDFILKDLLS
jgi:hypothetical protein